MAEVAQTVTEAHAWGADTLFVTNASGSLRADVAAGEVTLIADHINLMGDNPLRGSAEFLDLSDAYDRDLRRLARSVAAQQGLRVQEVVYVGVGGPVFETPAEVRMFRLLGGDVAGMSTIPEVIMARKFRMRVLAVSVVTNRAGAPASALDVVTAAESRAEAVAKLLEGVAAGLGG
jgi:purine-nucleoside phosphorylase